MTGERIAGVAALAVVVAGVTIGFATIGSPQHERLLELDHRRVRDLISIESTLRFVPDGHPSGLQATLPAVFGADWPRDPATAKAYEFKRLSATRYRLCALFALPSDGGSARWRHGAGRTCFDGDIGAPDRSAETFDAALTTTTLTR